MGTETELPVAEVPVVGAERDVDGPAMGAELDVEVPAGAERDIDGLATGAGGGAPLVGGERDGKERLGIRETMALAIDCADGRRGDWSLNWRCATP